MAGTFASDRNTDAGAAPYLRRLLPEPAIPLRLFNGLLQSPTGLRTGESSFVLWGTSAASHRSDGAPHDSTTKLRGRAAASRKTERHRTPKQERQTARAQHLTAALLPHRPHPRSSLSPPSGSSPLCVSSISPTVHEFESTCVGSCEPGWRASSPEVAAMCLAFEARLVTWRSHAPHADFGTTDIGT